MSRKGLLAATAFGVIGVGALSFWQLAPLSAAEKITGKNTQPNVIIILADDLGYADVSVNGNPRIPTPNIDRLANQGTRFTAGYVAAPVCAPSRAALMTGRYPQRFGFEFNNGPPQRDAEENYGIKKSEITLGNALRQAGYKTALVGKWHLGSNPDFYPTNRGFDEFFGITAGATAFIDVNRPDVISMETEGSGRQGRTSYTQVLEGPDAKVVNNMDKLLTEEFTAEAVNFIERNKAEPFFLYMAYTAPHDPFQITRKYYDRFAHIKDEKMRIYAAMVSSLDDGVGEIMAKLEKEGLAENTIVVFLSDNGCASYIGVCDCQPLRGGKLSHFEGGVRVPFMMRWPGKVPAGKTYDKPVSSLDIFPTVIAAAGGTLAKDRIYDGVNLLPYVSGRNNAMPHAELYWARAPHASVRDGDWKLWQTDNGAVKMLFNLKNDPNETNNLYSERPEKVDELLQKIEKFRSDKEKPLWTSRPAGVIDYCGQKIDVPV